MFQTSINSTGRKRPFVPKVMKKHGKPADANPKRRKFDKSDSHDGQKKFNKSDNEKKDFKPKSEKNFGVENNKNAGKSAPKKLKMTSKPKKTKGKKKTNRNKNK